MGDGSSDYTHPPEARMLNVVLEDEGVDSWDWILQNLAEGDPIRKRKIREQCRPKEIAETYAMSVYTNSAELKD